MVRSYCLTGTTFQFCQAEKALQMDGGDVYTAM